MATPRDFRASGRRIPGDADQIGSDRLPGYRKKNRPRKARHSAHTQAYVCDLVDAGRSKPLDYSRFSRNQRPDGGADLCKAFPGLPVRRTERFCISRKDPGQQWDRTVLHKTEKGRLNSVENPGKPILFHADASLITVWLQVRVLPGPPINQRLTFVEFFHASIVRPDGGLNSPGNTNRPASARPSGRCARCGPAEYRRPHWPRRSRSASA